MKKIIVLALSLVIAGCASHVQPTPIQRSPLVLMTDFGLSDGAVSEMKGVAYTIDSNLNVSDLTHFIPPYNIWDGAYRLKQTVPYWPMGTVFVTVVDPGVGSERLSIVTKLKDGHFIVGPDNGLLTFLDETIGVAEVRVIDETKHRRKGSEHSHTFHGRDVYTYTAAQLASGKIKFEDVGPVSSKPFVKIAYQKPSVENGVILGNIPALDPNYGNVWTNIPDELFNKTFQANENYKVEIYNKNKLIYSGSMPMTRTFSAVAEGKPLMYINSLQNVSFALNMKSFASVHKIESGSDWSVKIKSSKKSK